MFAIERKQYIIELLYKNKRVLVSDLSRALNVTEETIRRDLKELEKTGQVVRSHGGAVISDTRNDNTSFIGRENTNSVPKNKIGRIVADLIENNMFLMIDTSTTSKAVINQLKNKRNITILTNSYRLINDLSYNENIHFIGTGGDVLAHYQAFVGSDTLKTIGRYHADLAILGAHAISPEFGFMESNVEECDVKIAMVSHCKKNIIVADHSKFNQISKVMFLSFRETDMLVTDRMPEPKWTEIFNRHNIALRC